jgi:hypothetical protein
MQCEKKKRKKKQVSQWGFAARPSLTSRLELQQSCNRAAKDLQQSCNRAATEHATAVADICFARVCGAICKKKKTANREEEGTREGSRMETGISRCDACFLLTYADVC